MVGEHAEGENHDFATGGSMRTGCKLFVAAAAVLGASGAALADDAEIARGKYLVTVGGCNDCHTPGALLGKPDFSRALGGSEVGFAIPGLGVFAGPNLTPDKDTGLGNWTDDQIVTAITAGTTPEGRRLAPIMPYAALSHLTSDDSRAIVAYLRSLPPVKNKVPGPFGPKDTPTTLVFVIVPGEVYAKMPMPPP
jgi:mono/diheme cytochrome c family protein